MTHEQEIEKLAVAMKETNSTRMYERYLAIRLHLEGRTLTEIAKILGRSFPAISGYWKSNREEGLRGLEFGEYPGGIRKLSDEQEQQLKETIAKQKPVDVGFEAKYTWTLKIIRTWIHREFGEAYTLKGVSKLLNRLGFSYTKATYTLVRADKKEQKQFREGTLTELKQKLSQGEIDHLLFEDESMTGRIWLCNTTGFPRGSSEKYRPMGNIKAPNCLQLSITRRDT